MARKHIFLKLLLAFIFVGTLSCNSYDEHDGKWVLKEFPQYTFEPLDSTWEPGPCPTSNCVMFFGKQDTGTHIGVFLHSIPPGGPSELMDYYLSSDAVNNRIVLQPVTAFREGVLAVCENRFNSFGAEVQALEAFVIIPTSTHLIGFTFKRRIQVDSWDFRSETGPQVLDNLKNAEAEFSEFLRFCEQFREKYASTRFEEYTSNLVIPAQNSWK